MIERKKLNGLVVIALSTYPSPPRAIEIYSSIRFNHPNIFREEKITTFRGFVKTLNSFPEIIYLQGPQRYTLKKL